jgi:hypothetical protein
MTQTVCANLVRLRKKSVEQGDKGEPEARDSVNRMFLSELEKVICRSLVDRIPDETLRAMYRNWVAAINAGAVEEADRHEWMCGWVVVWAGNAYQQPERAEETNVVSLR